MKFNGIIVAGDTTEKTIKIKCNESISDIEIGTKATLTTNPCHFTYTNVRIMQCVVYLMLMVTIMPLSIGRFLIACLLLLVYVLQLWN